jgi:hypothetical protein
MEGLAKIAASFDAQRKKQYWQLLKRLYGGSDEAVHAIKATGDSGIHHGTIEQNIPSIIENGLKPGHRGIYGDGQYFGSKKEADFYARNSHGTPAMVRFKKPSELKETKELYPVRHAAKMDFNSPMINSHYAEQARKAFREENEGVEREALGTIFKLPGHIQSYLDFRKELGLLNNNGKYMKAQNKLKQWNEMAEQVGEKARPGGKADEIQPEMHQFRHYGKSPSPYVKGIQNEVLMFHNQPSIPSTLLKREKLD